jgi:hypothetical protein
MLFAFIYSTNILKCQTLNGIIKNTKNEPLPYANIFCPELNKGTTSNTEGKFIFKLLPGRISIIFSYVGYKNDTLLLDLKSGENLHSDIILEESTTQIPTIYVLDSGLSEAERIILRTIACKKEYLEKIDNYEYTAYDKTVLSAEHKDSVMIGGLLESISKSYFQKPDKYNEVILSKKQTKNMLPIYTNFFTMGQFSSILDEEIRIDESSVVGPLNESALDYYSFKMKDTTYYDNRRVYVISFEPKSKIIPLFSGEIGIADEIFLPAFFKLNGLTGVITSMRKEIQIEGKLAEFGDGFWMPVFISEKYTFNMSLPGFPSIYGNHTCLLSEYKINNPDFNFQFTKNIQTENLVPDNEVKNLWDSNQQIALTAKEKKSAARIDSVVENFSFFGKSFLWLMESMGGFNNLPITSFNDFYHFNRVEGHYAGAGIKLQNIFDGTNLSFKTGYGFSDKKLKYGLNISYKYKDFLFNLGFFNDLNKLDRFYNYGDFDLTYQSWIEKNDYADYYYSKGWEGGIDFQLFDDFKIGIEYIHRKDNNAYLNSDWSLFGRDAVYRSVPIIDEGKLNEYTIRLTYDDKNYFDLGFVKIPDNSKSYFDGEIQITRGNFASINSGNYWQTHIILNGYHQSNSWFNSSLTIRGGINTGIKLVQNLFHLPGNYGTISSSKLFNTLTKDEYSGNKYAAIFLENNFNMIIYKILGLSFIDNSKYDFLIFTKYGWIDEEPLTHYSKSLYETGFGIGNILTFLRVDFTWRLQPNSKSIFYINLVSMYDF